MKRILFIFVLCFIANTFAQEKITPYSTNHFTINIKDGLTKTRFSKTYGDDQLIEKFGHVFQLQLQYTYNIKQNYGVFFKTDFGITAFNFDLLLTDDIFENQYWSMFGDVNYQGFHHFSLGFNYHKPISNRLVFNSNIGLGFSKTMATKGGLEANSNTGQYFSIDNDYNGKRILFSTADIGIDFFLKNKNTIGVFMAYEYNFKPFLEGDYTIYNGTSGGTTTGFNNNLSLGLRYSFTGYRKNLFLSQLDPKSSKKENKKAFKKDKKLVDPKSILLSAGVGSVFNRTIVKDDNNNLKNSVYPSWTFFLNSDIGYKNQIYYSIGVDVSRYMISVKENIVAEDGFDVFIASRLNLGLNKRFINPKNNKNYFNLFAGASISYQGYKKGLTGGSGSLTVSEDYYFSVNQTIYIKRNIFPTIYTGIEKDLFITKHLIFSIKYKYDQGFIKIANADIFYSLKPLTPFSYLATSKINGSAHSVLFGFKYKFLTAKNRIGIN